MSRKLFPAVTLIAIALSGCNDKTPEYQEPMAATPTVPADASTGTEQPPTTQFSEFTADLESLGKVELCALDAINGNSPQEGVFKVAGAGAVAFEGWAATTSLTNPGNVTVVLSKPGNAFSISGPAGIKRDDVATAYKAEALTNAGFKLELATLQVPAGEYTVSILHDESGAQVSCASPLKMIVE
ncbi:hypothetical protein [Pseudoxanthomonas sp. SE1]|uniref:hypothetical protein n=1 Tax=Pseudoxanthomonas sp. SE1 TaxID=1664560 RepID=UPI00240D8330|nr:hypothetical protein [Pseudoxanthomonas sp. SE1]WFC42607.1 hypothetical protein OY559_03520 [Pseudoxanthomonas sp. SE1]